MKEISKDKLNLKRLQRLKSGKTKGTANSNNKKEESTNETEGKTLEK